MSIQTFVIEHYYRSEVYTEVVNCTEEEVKRYCIAKSKDYDPSEESIKYDTLEAWVVMKTKPDSWLKEFIELTQPKRGIWWLAIAAEDLIRIEDYYLVADTINDSDLSPVKHFHVTLAFDVESKDFPLVYVYNNDEAGSIPVFIKGIAWNDKAAVLVVDVPTSCSNKHPHITLATADGVPPVYSNDMLAGKDGAYQFLPLEAALKGQLEFFEFK